MPIVNRLLERRRRYEDLSVSIEEHLAERIDELMEAGMARKQAEQAARREFGNVALMEQRSREQWQWTAVESFLADAKLAFRRLGKAPGFTVAVLLTLAIGMGANTTVFSVINRVLLRPLPYPDSDRLAALILQAPGTGGVAAAATGLQFSSSMFFTVAEHNRSFQSLGIWTTRNVSITGLAQPEEVHAALISDGVLETLGVAPAAGRPLLAGDQDPHGAKTVILSYGYWQRKFGGDRSVVGRSIQVDSQAREVVGVMPRGFRMIDQDFDVLIPFAFDRTNLKLAGFSYDAIARLKPGVTVAQADADMSRLIPLWMDSWTNGPGTDPHYYRIWRITPAFRPLKQQVIGNVSQVLWVVMATVGLVMFIACMNVANLMLVRAESRHQELAIRAALGAGRAHIVRELLIESICLGLAGGALAVGVAYAGLRLLVAVGPADLPRLTEIGIDGRSLAFTFLLAVGSGMVFGLIPAWKFTRANLSLRTGATSRTTSAGQSQLRSRNVLVVGQVAMALVLLVGAALMIRSFMALRNVDPGFRDPASLQTMRISVPPLLVSDPVRVVRMYNDISDKLQAIPGVSSVGASTTLPMEGFDSNWDELRVEGKIYPGGEPPLRLFSYVLPGYFQTLGMRLLAGRDLTWSDVYELRPMVIVSENFARENWGSAENAVGKRVQQFSKSPWCEVIGVVQDVHEHGVDQPSPVLVYWPALMNDPYTPQHEVDAARSIRFAIRSNRAGTQGLINQVQQAVWSVDESLPMASIETMQTMYGKSMARTSFTLVMLAIAGTMAFLLGLIGIYGVISYAVSQRTREIGIRLALGASRQEVQWRFVRSALRLTVIGAGIGLGAAAGLTQLIRSLLFGVSPVDAITYCCIPLLLIGAAALAGYLPARRAAHVNPVDALRAE